MDFLAATQLEDGRWGDSYGQQPGVVGIAVLAFLAHGEDPNFGKYRSVIRKGLESIVQQQNANTGMIGTTMYNHGFATLALAEAYGHADVKGLGPSLKKAVDLILRSQAQNPLHGWRYQAFGKDADTTVSGAQMVALYAARNAGVHVPDEAISKGLSYFKASMDSKGGVGYTQKGGANSTRTAIASLAFSLNKDRDSEESKLTFSWIRNSQDERSSYMFYHMYYMAQALFHGDMNVWRPWNQNVLAVLRGAQQEDGSWSSRHGTTFGTGASLLAMALNYRLMPIYER